jgi:hypothetical protein
VTHEAGETTPKASVLDEFHRCDDSENLLGGGRSSFVSHPEKAIALTIMALA